MPRRLAGPRRRKPKLQRPAPTTHPRRRRRSRRHKSPLLKQQVPQHAPMMQARPKARKRQTRLRKLQGQAIAATSGPARALISPSVHRTALTSRSMERDACAASRPSSALIASKETSRSVDPGAEARTRKTCVRKIGERDGASTMRTMMTRATSFCTAEAAAGKS